MRYGCNIAELSFDSDRVIGIEVFFDEGGIDGTNRTTIVVRSFIYRKKKLKQIFLEYINI